MFTGIIEEVGVVRRLERRGAGGRLTISARKVLDGTRLGDSIAVSGACLTVVDIGPGQFTVDCMPETLTRTTLGEATPGRLVNLERALALGDRLGGHLVLGHVDAVAEVLAVQRGGPAWEITFSLPEEIKACVAPKGSIAVDGISLTVVDVRDDAFTVGIIPFTLAETSLRAVREGVRVNLEADVLARYVQRALRFHDSAGVARSVESGGLTEELLRRQGFL
ncbi:MAG: riboflavin synthase [Thermoleophilia bacterium]|nr:riboflavin synthase [Thermoleophilia bacterium]